MQQPDRQRRSLPTGRWRCRTPGSTGRRPPDRQPRLRQRSRMQARSMTMSSIWKQASGLTLPRVGRRCEPPVTVILPKKIPIAIHCRSEMIIFAHTARKSIVRECLGPARSPRLGRYLQKDRQDWPDPSPRPVLVFVGPWSPVRFETGPHVPSRLSAIDGETARSGAQARSEPAEHPSPDILGRDAHPIGAQLIVLDLF